MDEPMQSETPQPAATVWMPIESAPKSGHEVLLWHVHKPRYAPTGVYIGQQGRHNSYWYSGGREMNPTHWMPLPEPPKAEAGRTEPKDGEK